MPSGPLRENLNALSNANIVIINGKKNKNFENKILKINNKIKIFYALYKAENLDEFKNKHLLAIAGIGNPENFFQLIVENNLNIKKRLIFPDHYNFSREEITNIVNDSKKNNLHIIMTEKDYFKIKKFEINEVKSLKVKLVIENEKEFINEIKSYMLKLINYFLQSLIIYLTFLIGRLLGLKFSRKVFSFIFLFRSFSNHQR